MGYFLDYEHFQECQNCGRTDCNGNECRTSSRTVRCIDRDSVGESPIIAHSSPAALERIWRGASSGADLSSVIVTLGELNAGLAQKAQKADELIIDTERELNAVKFYSTYGVRNWPFRWGEVDGVWCFCTQKSHRPILGLDAFTRINTAYRIKPFLVQVRNVIAHIARREF